MEATVRLQLGEMSVTQLGSAAISKSMCKRWFICSLHCHLNTQVFEHLDKKLTLMKFGFRIPNIVSLTIWREAIEQCQRNKMNLLFVMHSANHHNKYCLRELERKIAQWVKTLATNPSLMTLIQSARCTRGKEKTESLKFSCYFYTCTLV